ncbi:tRNA methyltransferase 10 homolog B-like [Dreissena polymorpha]|nr:tRNA methyltransferase 10 homolog B-like [Dreissena polymorpha]XP_052223251.1 tRNA methyltransferase 10 homolog B-like [Dreissena polymorpha]XP_052223253.1 tRNA methyltransferase 10 homolog B-like [Dreissena polymorpha]XP_052223254.1 tRNA methyltransferase 10 homolog B-like [Dreissena polymorpha]XP_052223255.1 tRNA methyltransferase 10 homolog B-like [Dreissena polymorpha]
MESAVTERDESGCKKTSELAIQIFNSSNNQHSEMGKSEKETIYTATTQKEKRPPRSERKRRRHEELLLRKRENRKKKKMEKKERKREHAETQSDDVKSKAGMRSRGEVRQRCEEGMKTGQIICIDCSLEHLMSSKEKGKLAMQVGRLYGSNRRADKPAHIYLTGLKKGGQLYQEMVNKNSGFENYLIDLAEKTHVELFPLDRIVYLSPDSCTPLDDIDQEKIYVIGGLVDEGIKKNATQYRALEANIPTARLPIQEHMTRLDGMPTSLVLAVNQVFDILLNFTKTRDWSQALAVGVPRRKGFVAHSNTLSNDQRDDHNNTHGDAHINAHSKENSNNHSNAHGNKESYTHSNEVT